MGLVEFARGDGLAHAERDVDIDGVPGGAGAERVGGVVLVIGGRGGKRGGGQRGAEQHRKNESGGEHAGPQGVAIDARWSRSRPARASFAASS